MKLALVFILLVAPLLSADYTTYIGDLTSSGPNLIVTAMTSDAAGNVYLTGGIPFDLSGDTATPQLGIFLKKLDPSGNVLFTKQFAGSGSDNAGAIAIDPSGNIYVAGTTGYPDLLLSNALEQSGSIFIIKFSPDANTVLYSTYLDAGAYGLGSINHAGADVTGDAVTGAATDALGNFYLTGFTNSGLFPVTQGLPPNEIGNGGTGAFFAKLSASGDQIVYSGVIFGFQISCPPPPPDNISQLCTDLPRRTSGLGIAVDGSGNAYIAGNTNTTDLPTTPGVLQPQGIGAFVAKIAAAGHNIAYLTYLGSTDYYVNLESAPGDVLNAIAVDSAGNTYLAGATNDPKFPASTRAYQATLAPGSTTDLYGNPTTDAFAAKLSPDGSKMVWATYLGGTGADVANSIALDESGDAWLAGTTMSPDFPNMNGWSTGGDFLAEVNTTGTALSYAARYPNETVKLAVALDSAGTVHAAGPTGIVAAISPSVTPSAQVFGITNAAGGATTGVVASGELISIYGSHIGPKTPVAATADSSGALPTSLGGVQVSFNGVNAPLLYVSDGQINAIVPQFSNTASLQIANGGATGPAFPVVGVASAPQVFHGSPVSPLGASYYLNFAIALNQDGTVNSSNHPAKAGSIVTIWATGADDQSLGQIATAANNSCGNCEINLYGQEAPGPFTGQAKILYAGAAPGLATAITQINFQVPSAPSINFGSTNVLLFSLEEFGETGSDPVALWVSQ